MQHRSQDVCITGWKISVGNWKRHKRSHRESKKREQNARFIAPSHLNFGPNHRTYQSRVNSSAEDGGHCKYGKRNLTTNPTNGGGVVSNNHHGSQNKEVEPAHDP